VSGFGDTVTLEALFRSDDYGSSWTDIAAINTFPVHMTSVSNGRLYLAAPYTGGQACFWVYEPNLGTLNGPLCSATLPAADNLLGLNFAFNGQVGLSRIGSFADGDWLRFHHVFKQSNGDYGLAIKMVRIQNSGSGFQLTDMGSDFETPPSGRSIAGASVIESDRVDWPENDQRNPAVIYWFEVNTTPTSGSWGPARAMYRYFWDTTSGPSGCLSVTSGTTCRTWPLFTDSYGDYIKGASWFDGSTQSVKFLPQWGEQDAAGNPTVSTNVLQFTP
jgi:hypothetical protein